MPETKMPARFALAVLVASLLAPPSGADAQRRQTNRPTILLVGDSNIVGWLGRLLQEELQAHGFDVVRKAKSGSGLAYPGYYDWRRIAPQLAQRVDASVVILLVGGNDGQSLKPMPGDKWTPRVDWREKSSWREAYAARLLELAERLRRDGRRLVVLSPTNRRPRIDSRKVKRIRDTQQIALDGVEAAWWIDVYSMTSNHDGSYLSHGEDGAGRLVKYRQGDGIHLTRAGAVALRDRVLPKLLGGALRGLDGGTHGGGH